MNRLIFGCGYLGSRVAALWRAAGDTVFAVTRSGERAREFKRQGWRPIVADVLRPGTLAELPAADTVLFAVARGRQSPVAIDTLYVEGLRNVLDTLPATTGRVIAISSTGVYGQSDGQWVDETSATQPTREGGRACLAAEKTLAAHPRGRGGIVLRMAGLYGPGRVPRRDEFFSGEPLADPGDGYLNLIHIDDAAAAVVAAAERAAEANRDSVSIYNVGDGSPLSRREYLAEVARALGLPQPRFGREEKPTTQGDSRTERRAGSKRIDNGKLLRELGVALRYPACAEGLRQALARP